MEEQFSGDEKGCTMNKKWTPGPEAGNNLYSSRCSNAKYGSVAWAQTTCEADPGCDWIHDFDGDGKNWRFCGSKAQLQPGDEKAETMLKTLGDGLIRLRDSRYAGAALSVEAGGNKQNGRVWMWSITRDEWQTWEFRADGTIRLKAYPDYALSMQEGGCRNHGGVHMAKIDDGDSLSMNVVWKIDDDGLISPKAFGSCTLAIQANQHRDRGRVWMWSKNKDVWQTWGGLPKAIPKGPKITKKSKAEPTPDEDEQAEEGKDSEQEDEQDPKKVRLYNTWKVTGCPNLPRASWGGWAWYLKQKDGTVFYDMYKWCTIKDKKRRLQCCAGKACTPTCSKQKSWPKEKSSLAQDSAEEEDSDEEKTTADEEQESTSSAPEEFTEEEDEDSEEDLEEEKTASQTEDSTEEEEKTASHTENSMEEDSEKASLLAGNSTDSLGPEAQSAIEVYEADHHNEQVIDV